MHSKQLIDIIFCVLVFVEFTQATPYLWGSPHINYDASLDPIEWSRSFVKDAVRKPRVYQLNSIDGTENKLLAQIHDYKDFNKRLHLSHGKYGANIQKKLHRRKNRTNARNRYSLV